MSDQGSMDNAPDISEELLSCNWKFDKNVLNKTLISLPLIEDMRRVSAGLVEKPGDPFIDVIVDANLNWPRGRSDARENIKHMILEVAKNRADNEQSAVARGVAPALNELKTGCSQQYVFATLSPPEIHELAAMDVERHCNPGALNPESDNSTEAQRAIYKIWLDHDIEMQTCRSIGTVKADAARTAFGALGEGIVWAVLDTGVDGEHPHFQVHDTLEVALPLRHRDYTTLGQQDDPKQRNSALIDEAGHGTHVAGIIAGEFDAGPVGRRLGRKGEADKSGKIVWTRGKFNEDGTSGKIEERRDEGKMSGMSPRTKILSLKVLNKNGGGKASNIIAALEYIQELNSYGRQLQVHGVNLSVGYGFEPAWFACGQSPVCVEVDRLVRSGVVVVAAAGNTGYGFNQVAASGPRAAGLDITINDPGNAELAITVGATHRDAPHVYGVSYFSSKGPTGDGRLKPDLVAPGEKILSCESGDKAGVTVADNDGEVVARYIEDSGTSMAAPHVSGVIAAFLSVRREFIGQPLRVKDIFLTTATDLGRATYFQGRGLVDLMRAIQSV